MVHGTPALRAIVLFAAVAVLSACPEGGGDDPAPSDAPARLVVMAPAAAEMLERLGVVDRIVGIGDYVTAPPAVIDLPRVGAYDAPNVERILGLGAGAVITAASDAGVRAHDELRSLGIEVVALDTSTFEGVFASLDRLGAILQVEDRAAEVASGMRRDLDSIHERVRDADRPRVLFVVGRDPLYVAGPDSHVDAMIVAAGGVNVASDLDASYGMLSMEAALERLPEIIVDTSDNRPEALRGPDPGPWAEWSFLPAVEAGRVFHVAPERLVIPGVRLPEMTERMGRMIHPEIFGDPQADDFAAHDRPAS